MEKMIDAMLDIIFMILVVAVFIGATLLYGDKDLAVRKRMPDYEAIGYYYQEGTDYGYGNNIQSAEQADSYGDVKGGYAVLAE